MKHIRKAQSRCASYCHDTHPHCHSQRGAGSLPFVRHRGRVIFLCVLRAFSLSSVVGFDLLPIPMYANNSKIFLETDRLLFRTHEPQDEDDFLRMHTDPTVRRYMGGQAWPREKALHRFREQYLGKPTETYGLWATILKEEGKYIGCCGLRFDQNEKTAYLAYMLAQPYWRRGLATEASKAFIDIAFTRLRLPRLLADVEKGNAASERILEMFGFKFLRQDVIAASGRTILILELSKPE
jgi:[ribosomal protein S5]-alanine N-acetyltransferase